ncbi:MAG: hypothetical protein SPL12_04755 [Bacteroidales bacterium]|nr:hypothetical protein [Bacteroidales bacterium]
MNIDHLIESIHEENALRRRSERRVESGARAASLRKVGRFALPAAAVAAVLLIVFLPRDNEVQASTPAPGIYCNSQCNPSVVMALIGNNINHIKQIQQL